MKHRVGSDVGQWDGGRFVVKADVDVTQEEIRSRNLWLIGNANENVLVHRYDEVLPIRLESEFDFAASRFDAKTNDLVASGIFDSYWGLDPQRSKIWLFE